MKLPSGCIKYSWTWAGIKRMSRMSSVPHWHPLAQAKLLTVLQRGGGLSFVFLSFHFLSTFFFSPRRRRETIVIIVLDVVVTACSIRKTGPSQRLELNAAAFWPRDRGRSFFVASDFPCCSHPFLHFFYTELIHHSRLFLSYIVSLYIWRCVGPS